MSAESTANLAQIVTGMFEAADRGDWGGIGVESVVDRGGGVVHAV